MTRARPLPPDERRAAIIAAANPLVRQYGAAVTTAQIAEAAGIAEGTLFRVFENKAAIISAAIADAISVEPIIAWLADLPDQPLDATARAILIELQERYRTASALFGALFAQGDGCRPRPQHDHAHARNEQLRLRTAIAAALGPHRAELAIDPEPAATFLIGLATISSHGLVTDGTLSDPDDLVALFLHGTSRKARP